MTQGGVMISLAEKLNPRQTLKTEPLTVGTEWPPKRDQTRVSNYEAYRLIWEGAHEHVLVSNETHIYGEYVSVNIPKVICTIPADLLFGEDLELVFPDDASDEQKEAVEEIFKRCDMQTQLLENAYDTGHQGDGVWTVGREADGESGKATIRTVAAENWFPQANPDDVRDIWRHRIAWEKKMVTERGEVKDYLRVIAHEKGQVLHELYLMDNGKIVGPAGDEAWSYFYPDGRPDETQEGIEGEFLVVHVPNFRSAREYYGVSEYRDTAPLFGVINARVTQVDGILDRHADPALALPADLYDAQTTGGKHEVNKEKLDIISIGEQGEKPEYITWDGQLEQNMKFIDQIVGFIGLVSDTAPQLIGRKDWGGDISGRALKIMLIRTLAKVARKRRYYDTAIPKILGLAQQIEGIDDPVEVSIKWPDGLPADVESQIMEIDARLANGTLDKLSAIKRLDGLPEDKAQEILDKIDEAEQSMESAVQQQVGKRERPNIPVQVKME